MGWVNGENQKWTALANKEKVDLVIAGHYHRFLHIQAGQDGNNFPILVVGQDQIARVDATERNLKVTVTSRQGSVIDTFTIPRQAKTR